MKLTFTDFKLTMGITDQSRDTEYSQILRGLLRELYTVYGIAISKDILPHKEEVIANVSEPIQLLYKNIVQLSIDGYEEGVDYELNKENGIISILNTGNIVDGTPIEIEYEYYLFLNESNEIIYEIYPDADTTIYHIDVKPFKVIGVSYNDQELATNTYYTYGDKFELMTAQTNPRIPYKLRLEVGYEHIPSDLKMVLYELAGIRFDMKDRKTYLIDRVTDNATGTSTTYSNESFPQHIKQLLYAYTGRRFLS